MKLTAMFTIKICGLTNVADAVAVVDAGADAIGLNFYPPSPRFISRDVARSIVDAVGTHACKVGLFVNAPVDEIRAAYDELGLDLIQLHGDEPPSILRELAPRPIMKAFRIGPEGLAPVRTWFDACMRSSLFPKLVLLDAHQVGKFGGTGATTDWQAAAAYARTVGLPPLVLAGGLTSQNVAEAIHAVHPVAVDTASGVESSPGRKDAAMSSAFVSAAQGAFAANRLTS